MVDDARTPDEEVQSEDPSMFTNRPRLTTWFLLAILAVGSFRAARFATANPGSRAVYNLAIDTDAYHALALALAATGDLHTIPATQPPGFIVLLASIYSVSATPTPLSSLFSADSSRRRHSLLRGPGGAGSARSRGCWRLR